MTLNSVIPMRDMTIMTVVKVEIYFASLHFLHFFWERFEIFLLTLNSVIPMLDKSIMTIFKVELKIVNCRAILRYDYWYWFHLLCGSTT